MGTYGWVMFSLFILIFVFMFYGISAQSKFRKTNLKWSQVRAKNNLTGAQIAQEILAKNGIQNVVVMQGQKEGVDHYDPRKNHIVLSPSTYGSASISAQAIAAHEVGHALQWAHQEFSIKIRDSLAGPVGAIQKVTSTMMNIAFFFLFWGILFSNGGVQGWMMFWMISATVMYGAVGVFQLATLPVEYGASRKAKHQLASLGFIENKSDEGTNEVLSAASKTYLIAFLMTLTMFLYLLLRLLGSRR
ncbi:MAG: hypothetical protein GQ557_00070 [Mycoplasmataceae bacterium]|nr:hypothetical protein [Mycoplasmataceae bacterium]